MEGYSRIFRTSGECVVSRILLKNVLSLLPADTFIRLHRSFVVSKSKIKSFSRQEVILNNGRTLPVGRQYSATLLAAMNS